MFVLANEGGHGWHEVRGVGFTICLSLRWYAVASEVELTVNL